MAKRQEQSRRAECIQHANLAAGLRRHMDELLAAHPKDDGRDEHEDSRNGEGHAGPEILLGARYENGRKERTEVDAEIKDLIDRANAEPVSLAELIAHVR